MILVILLILNGNASNWIWCILFPFASLFSPTRTSRRRVMGSPGYEFMFIITQFSFNYYNYHHAKWSWTIQTLLKIHFEKIKAHGQVKAIFTLIYATLNHAGLFFYSLKFKKHYVECLTVDVSSRNHLEWLGTSTKCEDNTFSRHFCVPCVRCLVGI